MVAVGGGERLHHAPVLLRLCVHGIAQHQLAVAAAVQLDGEGVIRRVIRRAVIGVRFGQNIPAVEAAHHQIGLAVILLQRNGSCFAAAEPDGLRFPGAVARGLDAQAQPQLIRLVRDQVAHPKDRVALRIGGRLFPGIVQLIGHRDRRAVDRVSVRIADPDAKLIRGDNGDGEIRTGGVLACCQIAGGLGKAACIGIVIRMQFAFAVVHRGQVGAVMLADARDDLPELAFGLQDAVVGGQAVGLARLAALAQADAVENRQAVLLQLRLKAGKGVFQLAQLPLSLLHLSIRGSACVQPLIILDDAQQAAHPVGQEPVRPLPHLEGVHVRRGRRSLLPERAFLARQTLQGTDLLSAEAGRLLAKAHRRAQKQAEHQHQGKKSFHHGSSLPFNGVS